MSLEDAGCCTPVAERKRRIAMVGTAKLYIEADTHEQMDAIVAAIQWLPIETAPKNGITEIIGCQVFEDGHVRRVTMIWSENGGLWSWRANVHSYIAFEPQYWMPLLDPPQSKPATPA